MNEAVRIGIVGYGNLGRGVEIAVGHAPDLEIAGVFTRRDTETVKTLGAQVYPISALDTPRDDLDVLVLCGGSKSDLPEQTPELASRFSLVDSFDTHAKIPEHFTAVDAVAREAGTTVVISAGWDPGLFSVNRLFGEAILPEGDTYTFWGRGLSQGHSDAIRRIPGVKRGVQYTIPSERAIDEVRAGARPELTTREKHTRHCVIVLEEGADADEVRDAIVTMPDYFEPYDTTVDVIDEATFDAEHQGMPHGGFVIRSGVTAPGTSQVMEYRLALDSNPEFTASVLVAYARAVARLAEAKDYGAKTVFDIAPGLLSPKTPEQLRAELL